MIQHISTFSAGLLAFAIFACGNDVTAPTRQQGVIIYEKPGLVDSAVVNGCYPNTRRFFTDTLDLKEYSVVRVEFDGGANSDGSYIKVFSNTQSSSNTEIYSVEDAQNINAHHGFETPKQSDKVWLEIRIYINPPVCGEGEFKFTRARDLRIYGIN